MADLKPSDYILGILAFVFIMSAGLYLINSIQGKDSTFVDSNVYPTFSNISNRITDAETGVESIKSRVVTPQGSLFGALGAIGGILTNSYNAIISIFDLFSFMEDVYYQIAITIGMPPFMVKLAILAINVLLLMAIISIFLNRST